METSPSSNSSALLDKMIGVFDRSIEIDALSSLLYAIKVDARSEPWVEAAFAFDTNAVLRIPLHNKSDDIVDYLTANHKGPLILPGQVIQEFWNNYSSVVQTIPLKLKKSFESFKKELEEIKGIFPVLVDDISNLVKKFESENTELLHPDFPRRTIVVLEALLQKATVPFVPRTRLATMSEQRKKLKTPPGFKDTGDGDFFVWADLLFGMMSLKDKGVHFTRLILITNDSKLDWCRGEKAHPLLVAEVWSLLGVDFEIRTLDKLAAKLK